MSGCVREGWWGVSGRCVGEVCHVREGLLEWNDVEIWKEAGGRHRQLAPLYHPDTLKS